MTDDHQYDDDPYEFASEPRTEEVMHIEANLRRRARADSVLRWFRTCASCKSVWPPIDLFCESCWARLLTFENKGPTLLQPNYPFPVYSLFTWRDENERLVGAFLRAFKRGWCARVGDRLSERIALLRADDWRGETPGFIHPPGRRSDHSWLLAQKLSAHWNFASGPAIAMRPTKNWSIASQKSKSAADRSLVRYEREEKFSGLNRPIVFVDDVITTGSTAMAAYMALGDPARFAVWTLACRPKLAGKSRI